jgi:hypothetical protein
VNLKGCDSDVGVGFTLKVEQLAPSTFSGPVLNLSAASICGANQPITFTATWSIQQDRFAGNGVNPTASGTIGGTPISPANGVQLITSSYTPSGGMINGVETYQTTPSNAAWYHGPGVYDIAYNMIVDGGTANARPQNAVQSVTISEPASASQMTPTSYTIGSGNLQLKLLEGSGLGYGTTVLFDGQPLNIAYANGNSLTTGVVDPSYLTLTPDPHHTVKLMSCDGTTQSFVLTVEPVPSLVLGSITPET